MPLARRLVLALAALLVAMTLAYVAFAWLRVERRAPDTGLVGDAAKARPSDWFLAQRMLPDGSIPSERVEAARQARLFDQSLMTSAGPDWECVGPYNIGGRITALAALPGGVTVYLGSANGGVFKSVNSGVNWVPLTDATPIMSVGALAIDPADAQTVYVGTGESNGSVDSYDGNGLWRSRDGGASWQSLGLEATARIAEVAIDPQDSQHLLVAAMGKQFSTGPDRGLYRSTDGGASWTRVLSVNDSTGACDVVFNPLHPDTVYAATWERIRRPTYRRAFGPGGGVWRSVDRGQTWARLATGLPLRDDNLGRIGLAIAPSRPSRVYAMIISGASGGYTGRGVYRTDDGGQNWLRRDTGLFSSSFGGFGWYFGEITVDPTNPDRVYTCGVSVLRSLDGGVSYTDVTSGAHVDEHALWIDPSNPNRVLMGSDGGFYWTLGGVGWNKSLDLPITQFYAGTVAPQNANKILGGTQDNGTLKTEAGPSAWTNILGGDGFHVLVDATNVDRLFAEWQFASSGTGVKRSSNNGTSFNGSSGWVASDRFNWNTPFAANPRSASTMLSGSHRVYRTLDNGIVWAPISPDLTYGLPSGVSLSTLTSVAVSAPDTNLYYAGTDDGRVWRSVNRGTDWLEITFGLPSRYVTRVVPDPIDPDGVYVTLSGFGIDEAAAHVYRSTNRGGAWSAVDGNLPDVPANDLVVDPVDPQTLYLGTDAGVYFTRNRGAVWAPMGRSMPVQTVFDLELHTASRQLVAFTHGRSAWRFDLAFVPVSVSGTGAAGAALALSPLGPQPARGPVELALRLPRAGYAEVSVHDVSGRRVATLLSGAQPAGTRTLRWERRDASGKRVRAGVYFVRATSDGGSASRRVVLVD